MRGRALRVLVAAAGDVRGVCWDWVLDCDCAEEGGGGADGR